MRNTRTRKRTKWNTFLCIALWLALAGMASIGGFAEVQGAEGGADGGGENIEGAQEESGAQGMEEELYALEISLAAIEQQIEEFTQIVSAAEEGLAEYSSAAVEERVAVLRKFQIAYQRHLSAIREYEDILERRTLFEATLRDFQRLSEEPPYTMAFLDNLRDMVDHKLMDVEAERMSLRALTEIVAMERNDIPTVRAALNRASERLRTAGSDMRAAVQFEVDTARLLVEANEVELKAAEMELKRTETQMGLLELELDLARRRVEIARNQTLFQQVELDEIRERQQAVLDGLAVEAQATRTDIDRFRARIPAAEQALARAAESEAQNRAREELDLVRRQVEAARIKLAILESLQDYERDVIRLWELRYEVANPVQARERLDWAAIVARGRESLEVFNKERTAGERRAMSLRGQMTTLERRLEEWTADDGDRRIVEQQLKVLRDRITMRNRMQLRMAQIATLTERIIEEARLRQEGRPLSERISDVGTKVYSVITLAFDREITEIGGESITGRKIFYMLMILIFGLLVSRLLTRYIQNYALGKLKLRSNVVFIIAKLTNYISFIIVVYLALNYVNIPLTIFTFLGGAIALGVGFGAQNLINNFLSGLILMGEQPIRLGDIVEIEGKLGTITNIGARASRLRMFNGFDLMMPNSKFLETGVINWTLSDSKVRLQVEVGAAYGSPTREVSQLLMRAVTEHGLILDDPEPKVIFESFGDNALNFTVYFWVELGPNIDGRVIMSDVRHRIDKLFREADIIIAFPQRDIHLDSIAPLEVHMVESGSARAEEDQEGRDRKRGSESRLP